MKKTIKYLVCLFLVALLLSALGIASFADLGGFAGNSDFGGSDFGGGFDYDYDYGGGGLSTSDLFFLAYLIDSPTGVVVLIVILVVLFILRSKGKGRGGHTAPRRQNTHIPGAQQISQSSLRPMSEFRSIDPLFNEAEFIDKLSNMYVRFQNCWQKKESASRSCSLPARAVKRSFSPDARTFTCKL